MSYREPDEVMTAGDAKLGADVRTMMFDGADADAKLGGDLLVRFGLSDETKDAPFGGRQIVNGRGLFRKGSCASRTLQQQSRERRADEVLPGADGLDGVDYVGQGAVFQHITLNPEVQGRIEDSFGFVHGEENDFDCDAVFLKCLRHGEAIFARHV